MGKKTTIHKTEDELLTELGRILEAAANDAIVARDVFTIGVSGSSMTKQLAKALPKLSTEWPKWKFFFCDERVVAFNDGESTYGSYVKTFKNVVPVTEDQFVPIDPKLNAEEAAEDYIRKLRVYFPSSDFPKFDVLLLGMGPDGHTCSLFPNHAVLESSAWVAPITDSPKPPPSRITLTYPTINNSRLAIFVLLGENKADAVKRIVKDKEPLPAGRVDTKDTDVLWLLDEKAASQII